MSRYMIEKTDEREVFVGWDPPLGSFFAQEYGPDTREGEENVVWWVGYERREITSISDLRQKLVLRGVIIPPAVDRMLRSDAAAPWTPGPLQARLGFTGKEE